MNTCTGDSLYAEVSFNTIMYYIQMEKLGEKENASLQHAYHISIPSALKILRYDLTLCTARRQVIVFFFI